MCLADRLRPGVVKVSPGIGNISVLSVYEA